MKFFPDPYHIWWPIAVKYEATPGDKLPESTVLSVCRDPKCGVYGTQTVPGQCELAQIQQLTLCMDAAELTMMMDSQVSCKRWACRRDVVFRPSGKA